MRGVVLRTVAGFVSGFLVWLVLEPSSPGNNPGQWTRWENTFILALGALIGLSLGIVAGILRRSRMHILISGGLGLLLGMIGVKLGYQIGGFVSNMLFPGVLGNPNFDPRVMMARSAALTPTALGLGIGVGAASRKIKTVVVGAIGGLIAGIVAGCSFDILAGIFGRLTIADQGVHEVGQIPRALFACLLGGLVGFFIGLAERALNSAWIRLVLGRNEGKDWLIDSNQFIIGRNELADVPLMSDPAVHPQHAAITKHGDQYFVQALQPMLLNGQPVQQSPLASGDTLQIGTQTLQFMLKGHVAARDPRLEMMHQHPAPSVPIMAPQPAAVPGLLALTGPLTGQRFSVLSRIEIGRESSVVPLSFDQGVSRRHASVEPATGGLLVTDLGSTNGTTVNGTKITSQLVRIGETFTIGTTTFRIEL